MVLYTYRGLMCYQYIMEKLDIVIMIPYLVTSKILYLLVHLIYFIIFY